MIEEWLPNAAIASCHGADIADHNAQLFDTAVKPFVDMSLKGWVFYQGENNAGGLHGNVGTKSQPPSGYACLMAGLVRLWRTEWSIVPNTTDPRLADLCKSRLARRSGVGPWGGSLGWDASI